MSTKAIEIIDLSHIYNPGTPFEKQSLSNISLSIDKGDFVGIIGHTGSGKSTLIQMFNGLITPTSGTVLVNGIDINAEDTDKRAIRQKVGLVFQYPEHQLFELTVLKDVEYGPHNLGLSEEVIQERVRKSLRAVSLPENLWDNAPFSLSGGQKRRVAIAGVIAMEPDILVLDEPTAGLDPKGRDDLFMQLKQMHQELGITIILISHSMEDVAKYAKKLLVLHNGTIAFTGTPREIFTHTKELEAIGLAPPQIKYIVNELITRGFPLENTILSVEEAADAILKCL
ncbi:energy-coupling factor transporter ATPase [Candidatus Epulonipiscium viviparus]|uniref:energy-coupling factor transporter ATPase n=1 Tax=Candidatus Epulonipiscium viviparus TaxID=420336 RepID=UPI00016C0B82|nr:energy-coupling factor transporter ATPase [Candidatus Epulopiscium viviparus]